MATGREAVVEHRRAGYDMRRRIIDDAQTQTRNERRHKIVRIARRALVMAQRCCARRGTGAHISSVDMEV